MGVTREELVARAREIAPEIRERAARTEDLRRVPEENFELFKDAELLRAFVPREFGGFELELGTVIETSRELSRACGSSGWCLAICTLHNWMVAGFPRAAQEEVFGRTPDSVVAGVFMPSGVATPVDGGYRLTGQWDFASGSDHAAHVVLAGLIQPAADGPPAGVGAFLVRREDFTIEDNWFVCGLAGTGSKRVLVDDVFVRTDWSAAALKGSTASELDGVQATGGSLRLPNNSVATLGLAGVPIGVAQSALALFQERLQTKLRVASLRAGGDQVAAQLRYSQSAAEIDSVELMVLRDCDEMERVARAGVPPTMVQRGRYRRDAAYAFQVCARAVARLLPASGAHAIFTDSPLQRAVRDTQVMATHVVADWDTARESYAKALLGVEIQDPVF